jgi:predicted nucleic acid-binding Zn ribbon protein
MEPVRTGLRNIMRDLLRARPAEEAVVLAWPLVCGKDVAGRTQAASFSDGCLTVEVPDGRWAAELKGFSSRYIAGFEALLGPVVKEVKFRVAAGK